MYTFHDLCSEDDIKVMSKASLQLSEEYLFLGDLLKPWKVEKQGTNGSVDFFFSSFIPYILIGPFLC